MEFYVKSDTARAVSLLGHVLKVRANAFSNPYAKFDILASYLQPTF